MVTMASRAVLRQSRLFLRRPAFRPSSTTSKAAAKITDTGTSAASKASEGLSKVTSAAGPAIAGAVNGAGRALRSIGGRTGKLIAFVDSLIPPAIYYSRVGIELTKMVFHAQKMAPPSLATFQEYFQPILNALRQPSNLMSRVSSSFNAELIRSRIRNVDRKQIAILGVTMAEVIGFFSLGEILGRFKLVGYRGDPGHTH